MRSGYRGIFFVTLGYIILSFSFCVFGMHFSECTAVCGDFCREEHPACSCEKVRSPISDGCVKCFINPATILGSAG